MEGKVRIVMHSHGRGEVFVDGVEIKKVRSVVFTASAEGQVNEVVITLSAPIVEIEGVANVQGLDSPAREQLVGGIEDQKS